MSDLARFLSAQQGIFEEAMAELRAGAKRSHWMWFIFPQIAGLGQSATARHYALSDLEEAREYATHPVLGARLRSAVEAILDWAGRRDAPTILGGIDAVKLRSSMTLFEAAVPDDAIFAQVIDAFYGGERDPETLCRL
jgi:uncharacterized protein (DUF1810 family)